MQPNTRKLWEKQDQHHGDRRRLFAAVGGVVTARSVLYPGSFVDIAPSFVFASVTYLDMDKRAPRFFEDADGLAEIIALNDGPSQPDITFVHGDYTKTVDLPHEHFDLLCSLYAGFISEHCTQFLKVGGSLLVNPSHGDAAMASIDDRYQLAGVVLARDGNYRISTSDLASYLVPKKPQDITVASLHEAGRGIGYTKSPFAYLFTRVA